MKTAIINLVRDETDNGFGFSFLPREEQRETSARFYDERDYVLSQPHQAIKIRNNDEIFELSVVLIENMFTQEVDAIAIVTKLNNEIRNIETEVIAENVLILKNF